MDGTIHLSGAVFNGAAVAIKRMRKQGKVFFITNYNACSRRAYVDKLNNMGIPAKANDMYTSINATIDYLHTNYKDKKIHALATEECKQDLIDGGVNLVDNEPDLVVIAFDTELTYAKLKKVCTFIRHGTPFIATHPDFNCPSTDGGIPDVGSFLALIKASTGKEPIEICGKPFTAIGEGVKKLSKCESHEVAMIGDRLMTDIKFANKNNFAAVLVLSGEATMQDYENQTEVHADVILDSIADMFLCN